MVIPPSCPGVNVEILVDGQPLQEYDEIDECPVAPNTAIKYIEARSEAEFAVKVRIDHDFPFPAGDIEVKTILDQQHTARKILEVRKLFNPVGMLIEGYKARIGYGTDVLYKFRFVALDLVEGNHVRVEDHEKHTLNSVGTISVKLQFIRNMRPCQPGVNHVEVKRYSRIPEKALKGHFKSHYASLGQPLPISVNWCDYDLIGKAPFVTVNFKYRSLAALRALHIIPREPTPLPLEERPEDELTPDELRQVLRLYKERDAAALKIKKEAAAKRGRSSTIEAEDDEVEIVEAPTRKRRRGENSEVIVLE